MPLPPAACIAIAALNLELVGTDGDTVPTEAHLLPPGPFRAVDGRPAECPAWQLDAGIAAAVIARAAARKTDILIDFEHQSLRSQENGQRVEAAGWIPGSLEWRDGKGLYALGIVWVGDTAQLIAARKVRYISAIFVYDASTGAVLEIVSVALTNTPALDGLDALADLARKHYDPSLPTSPELHMPTTSTDTEKLAALTQERDGLNTRLAALTQELGSLKTNVAALTQERDALLAEKAAAAQALEKDQHAQLLQTALSDGRLTPAQKTWAEKQSLAALTEYLQATAPVAMLNRQAGDGRAPADDGKHGLSETELAMCSRLGVAPADFAKTKTA